MVSTETPDRLLFWPLESKRHENGFKGKFIFDHQRSRTAGGVSGSFQRSFHEGEKKWIKPDLKPCFSIQWHFTWCSAEVIPSTLSKIKLSSNKKGTSRISVHSKSSAIVYATKKKAIYGPDDEWGRCIDVMAGIQEEMDWAVCLVSANQKCPKTTPCSGTLYFINVAVDGGRHHTKAKQTIEWRWAAEEAFKLTKSFQTLLDKPVWTLNQARTPFSTEIKLCFAVGRAGWEHEDGPICRKVILPTCQMTQMKEARLSSAGEETCWSCLGILKGPERQWRTHIWMENSSTISTKCQRPERRSSLTECAMKMLLEML